MALLTAETQPCFETTLKSKAVSENCTVKFSCVVTGYPAPQVTWYKDDEQLDRLCGLPKYEIFCKGQNHSLHIYNCSVEDAAVYQASAINLKGIVSCSGVLEVGEMNEFKIHQRYFAKLKQRAENRSRESKDKENQERHRTASPNRTQRKCRSEMEVVISTPSPTGEEAGPRAEAGLQEAMMEEPGRKAAPASDGAESAKSNGQTSKGGNSESKTYVNDPAPNSKHQAQTTFVSKKIKISSSAKVPKADAVVRSASSERTTESETPPSVTQAAVQVNRNPEVTELKNNLNSATDFKLIKTENEISATKEAAFGKSSSKDEKPAASESRVAACSRFTQAENKYRKWQKHGRDGGHPDAEKQTETRNPIPPVPSMQKQSTKSTNLNLKREIHATKQSTAMDNGRKSTASFAERFTRSFSHKSPDIRTVLTQSPPEVAESQKSETETSQQSASPPAVPGEVTPAHAGMNGNDAPVSPEPPPDECANKSHPPRKTDDIAASCLCAGLRTTSSGSRELNESRPEMFSPQKKAPLEIPGGAENLAGCKVSPAVQQSQVDTAIKTVEGTETRDVEKAEVSKKSKSDSCETLETKTAAQLVTEENKTGQKNDSGNKHSGVAETKMDEPIPTAEAKSCSDLPKPKSDELTTSLPALNWTSENIKSRIYSPKPPKPEPEVISIAELLRSQIKALESPVHPNLEPRPTTQTSRGSQDVINDKNYKSESKTFKPDNKTETSIRDAPVTNPKATLVVIYQQLHENGASVPAQASNEALISLKDTEIHERSTKYNKAEVDANREAGPLNKVPSEGYSVISDSGRTNAKQGPFYLSSNNDNKPKTVIPQSQVTVTSVKTGPQEKNAKILELSSKTAIKGHDIELKRANKTLNSEIPSEEQSTKTHFYESQTSACESRLITNKQENGIPLVPLESPKSDVVISPTPEASPQLKKHNCVSPIPSATTRELASGARRKISTPKSKPEEVTSSADEQTQKDEAAVKSSRISTAAASPGSSRRSPLLQPAGETNSGVERISPISRRKRVSETQTLNLTIHTEGKPAEKTKHNPFKAPQVIRKIRAETFSDASGHVKLWCQFFNILSDSTVKWYKNEEEIAHFKRSAGEETPINLAVAQASSKDSGVYGCSITNEYGTDSTDFLLSAEILAGMSLHEALGVGEEIEMTPLIFTKGLADSGTWVDKFFGRIMMAESHLGDGCSHKVWRAKVIYGLEPVFESGNTCVIKVRSPITYGGKEDSSLIERNLDIMKKECKAQNLAREYCKIFSAEARVVENFGPSLEVIPVYLIYRPANAVPYATVETNLEGVYKKYADLDHTGGIDIRTGSEVGQKCSTFQHWIFQWTNGNLLLTRLEGVDTKLTGVGFSVKSTGHQGLTAEGNPKVFEHFVSHHKCNYFCGLLGLKPLKVMDSLMTPVKPKGSRSPLLQRKKVSSSCSPQLNRKAVASPRPPRKAEQDSSSTPMKEKATDVPKVGNTP
nr:alpha-protein kinase 3 isoform X2 [Nothobranchius furzeri]